MHLIERMSKAIQASLGTALPKYPNGYITEM